MEPQPFPCKTEHCLIELYASPFPICLISFSSVMRKEAQHSGVRLTSVQLVTQSMYSNKQASSSFSGIASFSGSTTTMNLSFKETVHVPFKLSWRTFSVAAVLSRILLSADSQPVRQHRLCWAFIQSDVRVIFLLFKELQNLQKKPQGETEQSAICSEG